LKSKLQIQLLTVAFQHSASTQEPRILKGNEHHLSPVDKRSFPKGGANKETRKRKSSVSAILTDSPVKPALESEGKAHRKPGKCYKLLRAATKIYYGNRCRGVQKNESSEEEDNSEAFVWSVLTLTQCPEQPQSGSNALSVINEPTIFVPDLAIFMCAGIATLMIIMRISCLNTDVMFLM